jgi:hypothetical protein
MRIVVSRAKSPQNVRVAARSRIFSSRPESNSTAPEDWVPSALQEGSSGPSTAVTVKEVAEAPPADPAAAAELGAEVQRLRRERGEAEKRAQAERNRAERAEQEVAGLRERTEKMKRAAAQAAAVANPDQGRRTQRDASTGSQRASSSFERSASRSPRPPG